MKYVNWAVLAALAFALLFTSDIVVWLGMDNTLQSAFVVIAPLVLLAAGLEWLSRHWTK